MFSALSTGWHDTGLAILAAVVWAVVIALFIAVAAWPERRGK